MKKKFYEVVGVFGSVNDLNQAANELFIYGFDQSSLSVPASEEIDNNINDLINKSTIVRDSFYAEENINIAEGAIIGVLLYITTLIVADVVIAKDLCNAYLAIIISAIVAASMGILLAMIINKYHKHYIEKQLKKGGLILWVRLKDKDQKAVVKKILLNNHATNVHLRHIFIN